MESKNSSNSSLSSEESKEEKHVAAILKDAQLAPISSQLRRVKQRLAIVVGAVIITSVWLALGLVYQYEGGVVTEAPVGFCEEKMVGTPVLEPINAWSSIAYLVFSSLVFMSFASYHFVLIHVKQQQSEQQEQQTSKVNLVSPPSLSSAMPSLYSSKNTWKNVSRSVRGGELGTIFKMSMKDLDVTNIHSAAQEIVKLEQGWSFHTSILLGVVYASIGVLLGVGSFLFHARYDSASSLADFSGMMSIAAFGFSYAFARVVSPCSHATSTSENIRWSHHRCNPLDTFRSVLFVTAFSLALGVGFILRTTLASDPTLPLMGVFGGLGVVLEFFLVFVRVVRVSSVDKQQDNSQIAFARNRIIIFVVAIVLFALGFFFWTYDKFNCVPTSAFQGHATWHVLTAMAYYVLYTYYFSESAAVDAFTGQALEV